jgi:vesicle-fusing ATPase
MDGVEDYGHICIIGSNNRIDILDEALLRPGRFDLKIKVYKPDQEGCHDILNKVTRKMRVK